MYDDILIPTDGSDGAEEGVEHGLELASVHDATVHSIYVVDENVYGETPALSSEELYLEELAESGRALVSDVVHRAEDRGLDAAGAITRGTPCEEIADYADEEDVDLIVMGVHGHGAHGTPHIGPVTERVLRTAETPVLPV